MAGEGDPNDNTEAEASTQLPMRRRLSQHVKTDMKTIALILVYSTIFIDIMGVANLLPVIPFLVRARPHPDAFPEEELYGLAPGSAMSLILFSYNAALLVSILAFGPLSDRFGRKPLLLASLAGGTIGYTMQGVAVHTKRFTPFIAMRVFAGLFGGSRPVAISYIVDTSPPDQRAKRIGMSALAACLAVQFGPVLGGSLGTLSLQLPCYVSGGLSAIGFILVASFVLEPQREAHTPRGGAHGGVDRGDRAVLVLNLFVSFCAGFWVCGSQGLLALLASAKFDFDPNKVGLAALGDGIMVLVGNPIYMWLIKHLPLPAVASIGAALMSVAAVCPYLDLVPMLVFRYIATIGVPVMMPCCSAIVAAIAPAHLRGAWTGMTLAVQGLGRAVGPLIAGALFDVDYNLAFGSISIVTACGAVVSLFQIQRFVRKKPGAAPPEKPAIIGKQGDEDVAAEGMKNMPSVQELSCHAEELVLRMRRHVSGIQSRVDNLEAGDEDVLMNDLPTPGEREEGKAELIEFLVQILEAHNYSRWPKHLDAMKLMLFSAFPPLPSGPPLEKLTSVINVFEAHIQMAEQTGHMFDSAEDLLRGI